MAVPNMLNNDDRYANYPHLITVSYVSKYVSNITMYQNITMYSMKMCNYNICQFLKKKKKLSLAI